jgi:hypothetical protein
LARVISKECQHLTVTDQRLFSQPFNSERAVKLESDIELAERVEAFVGRFARLQDTVGDKMLPVLLIALGENATVVIDEYVEDPAVLASALQAGHDFVPELVATAKKMIAEVEQRVADTKG